MAAKRHESRQYCHRVKYMANTHLKWPRISKIQIQIYNREIQTTRFYFYATFVQNETPLLHQTSHTHSEKINLPFQNVFIPQRSTRLETATYTTLTVTKTPLHNNFFQIMNYITK